MPEQPEQKDLPAGSEVAISSLSRTEIINAVASGVSSGLNNAIMGKGHIQICLLTEENKPEEEQDGQKLERIKKQAKNAYRAFDVFQIGPIRPSEQEEPKPASDQERKQIAIDEANRWLNKLLIKISKFTGKTINEPGKDIHQELFSAWEEKARKIIESSEFDEKTKSEVEPAYAKVRLVWERLVAFGKGTKIPPLVFHHQNYPCFDLESQPTPDRADQKAS